MADTLAERKRRLQEELAEVRAALKVHKKEGERAAKQWALPDYERATVLSIYILSGQDLTPAKKYLRSLGRIWHWDDLSDEDESCLLLDLYLGATDDELEQLVDPDATPHVASLQKAHGIVESWRSTRRVASDNQKGLKPSSVVMHIEAEQERLLIPEAVRPISWGIAGSDASRQRIRRLRLRYGGRFGQLPVGPELSAEEMRAKAFTYDLDGGCVS